MQQTVIGAFRDHAQANAAVEALKANRVPEKDISLVAREDGHTEAQHPGDKPHNLSSGIGWGSAAGGTIGLLAGVGALAIPGIGPIVAAGPLAATLTGAVAGGITGGLMDYGIPKAESEEYERRLKEGDLLLMVRADRNEVDEARRVFEKHGAIDVHVH